MSSRVASVDKDADGTAGSSVLVPLCAAAMVMLSLWVSLVFKSVDVPCLCGAELVVMHFVAVEVAGVSVGAVHAVAGLTMSVGEAVGSSGCQVCCRGSETVTSAVYL